MAISKIILNGTTQMDTTQVTVDSSNLLSGYTALGRDGETLTGTTTFPVQSVNNKTGAVVLNASDVGAIAAPEGGSVGQVLKKTASGTEWANESGGGGTDNTAHFAFEIDETNNNAVTPGTGVTISAIAAAASAGKACFADVTYVLENTSTTVLLLADYNNSYLTFTGGSYEDEQAVSLHGEDNQGADEWTATLEANLTYKLNKYQGVANAGKFMVVGNDGIVTPVAMAAWQGGSY